LQRVAREARTGPKRGNGNHATTVAKVGLTPRCTRRLGPRGSKRPATGRGARLRSRDAAHRGRNGRETLENLKNGRPKFESHVPKPFFTAARGECNAKRGLRRDGPDALGADRCQVCPLGPSCRWFVASGSTALMQRTRGGTMWSRYVARWRYGVIMNACGGCCVAEKTGRNGVGLAEYCNK